MENIKMLVMDVDGTLTDGNIYMSGNGEVFKVFSVKDGYAISKIHNYGIKVAIISGRSSEIVIKRAKELAIEEVYQGIDNKLEVLESLVIKYCIKLENVAYIGDDENDIECMRACGFSGCPSDAVESVKAVTQFISRYSSGHGAVREFIDLIVRGG